MILSEIRPFGARVLVRRYTKPERAGSIIIPEPWRTDGNRSIWEVIRSSREADNLLGATLQEDDIVFTPEFRGVYIDTVDGVDVFMIRAEEIRAVRRWRTEEDGTPLATES